MNATTIQSLTSMAKATLMLREAQVAVRDEIEERCGRGSDAWKSADWNVKTTEATLRRAMDGEGIGDTMLMHHPNAGWCRYERYGTDWEVMIQGLSLSECADVVNDMVTN